MESQLLYLTRGLWGYYGNNDSKNRMIFIDEVTICIYPRYIIIFVIVGGLQILEKSD